MMTHLKLEILGKVTLGYQIIMLCWQLLNINKTTRTIIIKQKFGHKISKSIEVACIYRNLLLACLISCQRWCNQDENGNEQRYWRQRHFILPGRQVIKSMSWSIRNEVDNSKKERK